MAKYVRGNPITGGKTEMRPKPNAYENVARPGQSAERIIKTPPQPFQSRNSAVNLPAPSNRRASAPAAPKAHPSIGVGAGMRKHVPGAINAAPLYRASAATHIPGAVGGGMPRSGKGAPAVMNGRVGFSHGAGNFSSVRSASGRSGAPMVKKGRGAFFGG